ncbi:dipeptidase [Plantactinospora siamensis]|uniref:Dipeptidase n=1 Tax=Plantactinospora siamensis TaxID=555372 RepID=A0ABV6P3R9_9ACTN
MTAADAGRADGARAYPRGSASGAAGDGGAGPGEADAGGAPDRDLRAAVRAVLPAVREGLERLVRIPSVSADPQARDAVEASAAEVARQLGAAGLPTVEVVRAPDGLPAVLGRRPGPPGAPTVLLYAHHDVQPAGDRAAWGGDPFEPRERDGRLFGRGAADDKAGVAVHCAALRALGDDPGVGVAVLIEGEEEIGSPTLPALLAEHRDRLAADVLVLADSTNWRVGVPALTTSLRGGVSVVVEVATLRQAVHNGVYGGPVPDALTALTRLLASLHDERGDVAVAGLSRQVADPLDLTEDRLRADAGVLDGVRLIGSGSLTSRLWRAPALSVIGIDAPPVDAAGMVLVPTARARLALRIGPGDDAGAARDALVRHLESHAPWGVRLRVTPGRPVAPFAARTDGPGYAAARAAFGQAWDVPPVEIGVGGSIAFLAPFVQTFPAAEVLITGVEDPDTRAHGPNESLHLADFERACLAEALLLHRLGQE